MLKDLLFRGVKLIDRIAAFLPVTGRFRPAKGSFSARADLESGNLEGAVLFQNQETGPCPPGSITDRCGLRQNNFQPWPAFWTRSEDAVLVGPMWHWRNSRERLCEEGVFGLTARRRLGEDRISGPWWRRETVALAGAWTSIASNWGDGRNYFHWMVDALSRLMIREKLPEATRILIPRSHAGYIRETLEMLDLWEMCECPDAHAVRPERYYFCSPTAMTGVWNPAGFDWLRERFAKFFASPQSGGRVFLTRRSTNRIPAGIIELERRFEVRGFRILDPGALSVREQIEVASGATAIAGVHGAAMTNLLWARPQTPVLEIFESAYLNGCYEQLAFQGRLAYQALVLGLSGDVGELDRWLENQSGEIASGSGC